MNMKRDNFLLSATLAAGAIPMAGTAGLFGGSRRNMCGYGAPALDKIRIGIIGLGMRGKGAVQRLSNIQDVEIVALCDLREEMVERSRATLKKAGRPRRRAILALKRFGRNWWSSIST